MGASREPEEVKTSIGYLLHREWCIPNVSD